MMFFKQKFVRIGTVVVFVVLMLFGLAMMGLVLSAKPKELPVGLVELDQPVKLPNGQQQELGETLNEQMTSNEHIPVRWIAYGSEEDLQRGLDRQEVYGAMVIPSDFTAGVMSIQTSEPKPAVVTLYTNEGMNAQGSAAVKNILQQVTVMMRGELSKQVAGQLGQMTPQIPAETVQALLNPFQTREIVVHPVGANNAGGGAPNMLVQIIWLASMVASVFMYLAAREAGRSGSRFGTALAQTSMGLIVTAAASGFLVWMASAWYGMQINDLMAAWLFLWLAAAAFFLLQTSLFNWIGIPAAALLVLLLFFSKPVLNMAPEFMPETTKTWLYSWTPFRYAASGLRSIFYYGAEGAAEHFSVLWWIAGVGMAAALAPGAIKRSKRLDTARIVPGSESAR